MFARTRLLSGRYFRLLKDGGYWKKDRENFFWILFGSGFECCIIGLSYLSDVLFYVSPRDICPPIHFCSTIPCSPGPYNGALACLARWRPCCRVSGQGGGNVL